MSLDTDMHGRSAREPAPIELAGAALRYGDRTLWSGLDLDVAPGEFVAVLGPNGSGKTSLLRVLLGLQRLSEGSVRVAGTGPRAAGPRVGYVPQQHTGDTPPALRGRDFVGLGLDGHHWGPGLGRPRWRRARVDAALAEVAAREYADVPLEELSGGERQRLRVAQALVAQPEVLLCDEPLLALDARHQRAVSELIAERKRRAGTAVLFVTHEINPILPIADRVLYLTNGRFRLGPPQRVLTGPVLSELYGTPVRVHRIEGQLHIAAAPSSDPVESHAVPDRQV